MINLLDPDAAAKLLDPSEVVLRSLLERNAIEAPAELFVSFEDGTEWSNLDSLRQACAAAHVLRAAGVCQGGTVGIALPNSEAYLRAWWGAAMLGATIVPIDTAYKGFFISHLLKLAQPAVIVTTPQFRARLLETEPVLKAHLLDPSDLHGANTAIPQLERPIQPWDPMCLCMTSGTTGPSKLVRISYAHCMHGGSATFTLWGRSSSDIYLCDIALAHASGLYVTASSVAVRNRIVVRTRPQLDRYWEVARDAGATFCQIYSTMVSYLEAQPARDAERAHDLRMAITMPFPKDPEAFRMRFGIEHLLIGYGSTETAAAIAHLPGTDLPYGSTGRALPSWHVRLVDENDIEVPLGTPGEAIVRADTPWLIATEYINNPAATASAWRNGWFHTGDLMRQDEEGNFFFLDRAKDCLRRRGLNISSFEVEAVVQSYPGVAESAVVAERSTVETEDEGKAWVVAAASTKLDFAEFLVFCVERLPHFMVPRYFETIEQLPKSISAKVQKALLRERGNSASTWDRVSHNLDVTRPN